MYKTRQVKHFELPVQLDGTQIDFCIHDMTTAEVKIEIDLYRHHLTIPMTHRLWVIDYYVILGASRGVEYSK